MVSVCVCLAVVFVVSGIFMYKSIFLNFENSWLSDDSISCLADFCRIFEFLYLFVELILLSGALSGGAVPCVTYLKLVLDNAVKIT